MKKLLVLLLVIVLSGATGHVLARQSTFRHLFGRVPAQAPSPAVIILSPHYDDAALSLGGFMASATSTHIVVATFFNESTNHEYHTLWDKISGFTGSNEAKTRRVAENMNALAILHARNEDFSFDDYQYRVKSIDRAQLTLELEKDIESLIPAQGDVAIYGPSAFGQKITHPDHALLHEAFLAVSAAHSNDPRVTFYMYEDFPYVKHFNLTSAVPLVEYLSQAARVSLTPETIHLGASEIDAKIAAIDAYTSQIRAFRSLRETVSVEARAYTLSRCPEGPCEVVYRINR